MTQQIKINGLQCLCSDVVNSGKIAYILYPMDMLADWIEAAAEKYGTTIVVITGMEWEDVFSPWPAKGVPQGSPDFKGESPEFLRLLQEKIVPQVENILKENANVERTLVGVSMSGLFALWQWMVCDTFHNIASLSGSFWYEGFMEWMTSRPVPAKTGKAYFLLGDKETHSKVKEFDTVGPNTQKIIEILRSNNISTEFQSVPGNHYANPIPRLNAAFTALFNTAHP